MRQRAKMGDEDERTWSKKEDAGSRSKGKNGRGEQVKERGSK